jgi:uracil-DNA glycosylase
MRHRPRRSDLLFVAEAPNRDDTFNEAKGHLAVEPETDPSGAFFYELYTKELAEDMEDLAVVNAVLCLPSERRKSHRVTPKMLRACQSNLRDQIVSLDPLVVVTLGTVALNATRAIEDHGLRKLADVSTRPVAWFGRLLFAAYHTGRQARNGPTGRKPEIQRQDWRELKVVLGTARASRGGQPRVPSSSTDIP